MSTGVASFLRKTVKRSANIVRRVGKGTRRIVRKGTNTVGLTHRKRHHRRHSRK